MAIICLAIFFAKKVLLQGDIDEYVLMSDALGTHYSPDIQLNDIQRLQTLIPEMKGHLQLTVNGMQTDSQVPKPGFYRGMNGQVYAIHFYTYSALAAIPFQIFQKTGIAPIESFLFVNLCFILLLGICFFRFFDSQRTAFFSILLFLLSGGWSYCFWLGPETLSAASLCASILLYLNRRPIFAGILIGLAATQNPPIILALAFVPLLRLVHDYQPSKNALLNVKQQFSIPVVLGLAIGALVFLSSIGFNLWAFGVPNIIVKVATNTSLVSWERLVSFFFDLNQGMMIGFVGIWLGIVFLLVRIVKSQHDFLRCLALVVVTVLFSIALSLPALTTGNWNSGAIGMMRYAFWAGMPFLALFLMLWRQLGSKNSSPLIIVFVIQLLCAVSALRYNEIEFSPIAKAFVKHLPAFYNPEPEIFVERMTHRDGAELAIDQLYKFEHRGKVSKILFHGSNAHVDQQLCGKGLVLGLDNRYANAAQGWQYLNGNLHCVEARVIDFDAFSDTGKIQFSSGWSGIETGGGVWNGRWSDGDNSVITIPGTSQQKIAGIKLLGHYFEKNKRTRVVINGSDLGWFDLSQAPIIQFNASTTGVKIDLKHEFPHEPSKTPEFPDGRRLSVFLQSLVIY